MKYKGYNIPNHDIDNYVTRLGCSIAEACDAWLFDNGKIESEEVDAMTKKAAAAGVGKIVDADYKKTERKPKERKVDEEKQFIIRELIEAVLPFADFAEIRNAEKYIDFIYNDNHYTVNLVKHRKKGE